VSTTPYQLHLLHELLAITKDGEGKRSVREESIPEIYPGVKRVPVKHLHFGTILVLL
jgi:hypothetical protein